MFRNLVNIVLASTFVQDVLGAIGEVTARLPFLVALSPQERRKLPKMGRKRLGFVQKAAEVVRQNPGLCPPDFNAPEFLQKADNFSLLEQVYVALQKVFEGVSDTELEIGVEAYTSALDVYAVVKRMSKRVPGLDTALAELKRLLKESRTADPDQGRKRSKKPKTAASGGEETAKPSEPAKQ